MVSPPPSPRRARPAAGRRARRRPRSPRSRPAARRVGVMDMAPAFQHGSGLRAGPRARAARLACRTARCCASSLSCGSAPLLYFMSKRERPRVFTVAAIFRGDGLRATRRTATRPAPLRGRTARASPAASRARRRCGSSSPDNAATGPRAPARRWRRRDRGNGRRPVARRYSRTAERAVIELHVGREARGLPPMMASISGRL